MKKAVVFLFVAIFGVFCISVVIWKIFPIKYKDEIVKVCSKYDLNPALVCSLINAESGYDEYAVSSAGAKGLMQLNPTTAEEIAFKLGYMEYDLFDYKTNIEFGCYYLSYLLQNFGDERKTLCAYNAGPNRVKDWDVTDINNIPIDETKNYVKKIEKYLKFYKVLYF